jgi:hypothetical protein
MISQAWIFWDDDTWGDDTWGFGLPILPNVTVTYVPSTDVSVTSVPSTDVTVTRES